MRFPNVERNIKLIDRKFMKKKVPFKAEDFEPEAESPSSEEIEIANDRVWKTKWISGFSTDWCTLTDPI